MGRMIVLFNLMIIFSLEGQLIKKVLESSVVKTTKSHNIICELPGVIGNFKASSTPLDYCSCLMSDDDSVDKFRLVMI